MYRSEDDDVTCLQNEVVHLKRALETRGEICVAMGLLMEREQITAEEAFDVLRRASQRANRKLHDIAAEMKTAHEDRVRGRLTINSAGDASSSQAHASLLLPV